jgi:NADPH:quinone reductase-like Zn-dependent oxidoreductase
MKAVTYNQYGPPEVLRLSEVEKPTPNPDQVLVKVNTTTVNRTDCASLRAKPFIMRFFMGLLKPKNPILGTEFTGVVEAVGLSADTFKVGDKVFGFADSGASSYAEYLVISKDKGVSTMPEDISFLKISGSIEGSHYAYNFINKVDLKEADNVLVYGASGSIGTAMVQLLKYFGADITAVCNTKNLELVKSLGAIKVIDYTTTDFTKTDEVFDFVFDCVGKSSFGQCKPLLKPGGTFISSELGWMCENLLFSLITALFGRLPWQTGKKVKFPYPPNIKRSILLVKKLIEEDKFRSVIDRVYSLEQIANAFRYVETEQKTGNVVITIAGDDK